jgi:transposase
MGNPAGVRRDFEKLERRRLDAVDLLRQGIHQSEVARRVGAHRQSVSRWAKQLEQGGKRVLRKAGRAGRKPRLSSEDLRRIEKCLKRGPQALGFETALWTSWRVAYLIERECGVKYHPSQAWRILRQLGWSCQRPTGRALERDEEKIREWKEKRWPEIKKNPQGRPHHRVHRRERTERAAPPLPYLGPERETPVLQCHFNWKTLSAMAGVTWWNFYFRLFPGAIRSPQVILFFAHLLCHIPGKLLIVWDGLAAHRSGAVWDFISQQRGRIWIEFLPAYAPELNPVEYLWSHWKQHELPNFCPASFGHLSQHARGALRRMRRRPSLVCAFWQQAELFPL